MAKIMTAACLNSSCTQQRGLRNFLKHAYTCQIAQLYINQVPHRCTRKPLSYRRDGQTDGQTDVISALYSRYYRCITGWTPSNTVLYFFKRTKFLTDKEFHCFRENHARNSIRSRDHYMVGSLALRF